MKIPKNLSDKVMFAGVKEQETFETAMYDEEPEPKPRKEKAKEEPSATALPKELQDKLGRALLELKLDLYKKGIVDYEIKLAREGERIVLTPAPNKQKTK